MNTISQLSAVPQSTQLTESTRASQTSGGNFKDFLLNSISEVNHMQQEANLAVEQLSTGGDVNPAQVLSAVQKADMAFRMMMQIRNKVVEAYDEVKNIRV